MYQYPTILPPSLSLFLLSPCDQSLNEVGWEEEEGEEWVGGGCYVCICVRQAWR